MVGVWRVRRRRDNGRNIAAYCLWLPLRYRDIEKYNIAWHIEEISNVHQSTIDADKTRSRLNCFDYFGK